MFFFCVSSCVSSCFFVSVGFCQFFRLTRKRYQLAQSSHFLFLVMNQWLSGFWFERLCQWQFSWQNFLKNWHKHVWVQFPLLSCFVHWTRMIYVFKMRACLLVPHLQHLIRFSAVGRFCLRFLRSRLSYWLGWLNTVNKMGTFRLSGRPLRTSSWRYLECRLWWLS